MNNGENTLIILSPGFPANEADSTCLPFLQSFAGTLKKLNPSLNIIVLAFQYPFKNGEYSWHGIKVISLNGQNRGKFRRLVTWRIAWNIIKKIVSENNVMGILNFWLGECALIGTLAAKKYKIKHFTWLLGQDAKANNRYFSLARPTGESLIALSDSIAAEFFKNYAINPKHTIPPGLDTTIFKTQSTIRSVDIIGVGSLIALKQFDLFVETVKKIKQNFPGIKAIICGAGPAENSLNELIDLYDLRENIFLTGELDHDNVLQMMQQSRILLHPSCYEGFSTVCMEALYAGCQVISFVQPMKKDIPHWHVVQNKEEMLVKTISLLKHDLTHNPVLAYDINDSAKEIMKLYCYEP